MLNDFLKVLGVYVKSSNLKNNFNIIKLEGFYSINDVIFN